MKQLLLLTFCLFFISPSFAQTLSTYTGNGSPGLVNGLLEEALFNEPEQMVLDEEGNLYVCDRINHAIRKIDSEGNVTLFAGTGFPGDQLGDKESATFNIPVGLAIGTDGTIYVVDTGNHKIKKITKDGQVELVAGNGNLGFNNGDVLEAEFEFPTYICVDDSNNLFVTGNNDYSIRKIDQSTNTVSSFAGNYVQGYQDGQGLDALFSLPQGIAIDKFNNLYVGDRDNNVIRKITPDAEVTTLAGTTTAGCQDGSAQEARFNGPKGVAVDDKGNVYVADRLNFVIRKIDTEGTVSTVAGIPGFSGFQDGEATSNALIGRAVDVICDEDRGLYISDWQNHAIRYLSFDPVSVIDLNKFPKNKSIQIYPNPATDLFQISGDLGENYSVYLIDQNGRVLLDIQNQSTVKVEDLLPGIYHVTVVGDGYYNFEKIILK